MPDQFKDAMEEPVPVKEVDTQKVRELMCMVATETSRVDCLRSEWKNATGEVKDAYKVILNQHQWNLQRKIGQLWHYVCGHPIVPIEETLKTE